MKTSRRNSTGENRGNGEGILCSLCFLLLKSGSGGVVELDFDKSISDGVNMNPESFRGYAKRDGDADFVFLACRAGVRRRREPAFEAKTGRWIVAHQYSEMESLTSKIRLANSPHSFEPEPVRE